jgi:hypothetical protein
MQRTVLALLAALAVMLVAVGGAAAIERGTAISDDQPDNTTDDGADVGVCVVGADSPCNDASDNGTERIGDDTAPRADKGSERIGSNDSNESGQIWIPEDQNRDGEIDDRFTGDDEKSADAGVCVVGADSPCNDAGSDGAGDRIGSDTGSDETSRIWIPEDQNRDGEIDDHFLGDRANSLWQFALGFISQF